MIDGQSWMVKFTCIWRYIQASNEGAPRPNDCGPNSLIYIINDSSHAHLKRKTLHLIFSNSFKSRQPHKAGKDSYKAVSASSCSQSPSALDNPCRTFKTMDNNIAILIL